MWYYHEDINLGLKNYGNSRNIGFKGDSNACLVVSNVSLGRITRLSFGTIFSVANLTKLKYL